MFTISSQPPVPTSLTDIPPPNQTSEPAKIFDNKLDDVIASPLYAYVYQPNTGYWENYNRVGLTLTVKGEWKLLAAATITPETPFHEETTIEEGIVSTESVERSFATDIGIDVGIPKIGLGASISTSLSVSTGSSIEISDHTSQTRILTATTTEPGGQVFWFWQLELTYQVAGDLRTWRLTAEGADALVADSRIVQTRDGEGRELKSGQQVPGAFRVGSKHFKNEMQVNSTILVTTQFPNGSSSKVMHTDTQGKSSTAIPTLEELINSSAFPMAQPQKVVAE